MYYYVFTLSQIKWPLNTHTHTIILTFYIYSSTRSGTPYTGKRLLSFVAVYWFFSLFVPKAARLARLSWIPAALSDALSNRNKERVNSRVVLCPFTW